jgi:FixJ family two-component response regulator
MTRNRSLVYVLDDDPSVQTALRSLLRSAGLAVETFGSPKEFLAFPRADLASCLVLDVRLKGANGLDFQHTLVRERIALPIVFITGHGDIPMTVRAMKAGAVQFLSKPFRDHEFLAAVREALDCDRHRREKEAETADLRQRLDSLTPRERELLPWIVSGRLNKEIAAALGTSEITVKVHRGHIMKKMEACSLADLVRISEKLEIYPPANSQPPASR